MSDLPLVRSSERSSFKRCPQQWYWAYVEGLVPSVSKFGAREFGTGIHLALAEWYIPGAKRGRNPLETWKEFMGGVAKNNKFGDDTEWQDMNNLGAEMLRNYLRTYKLDKQWEVIGTELRFAANVAGKALDVGTIDLVVYDNQARVYKVVDHKTAAQFPAFGWLYLDDQGGSYTVLAKHILVDQGLITKKDKVDGIIFNYLKKTKPDTRPKDAKGQALNKDGSVSKVQPPPLLHREYVQRTPLEKARQLQRIEQDADVMNLVRGGTLPVLKAPDKSCAWCDFFELCKLDEAQGDTDRMKEVMYKQRDPYEDHRDNARNPKVCVAETTLRVRSRG